MDANRANDIRNAKILAVKATHNYLKQFTIVPIVDGKIDYDAVPMHVGGWDIVKSPNRPIDIGRIALGPAGDRPKFALLIEIPPMAEAPEKK